MSFGIIRPIRPPRDLVNREREYERIPPVTLGDTTAAILGAEVTNGSGLASFSFTPPRGATLTLYILAPAQTAGSIVVPGFGSAPGTTSGAYLCLTVPGGFSSLNVYVYSAGGAAVAGVSVGLQGFAA